MRRRLAALPTGVDKARAVREMFDAIAPRYDLVNRVMTFRMDVRWRRRAIATLGLAPGARVYDLACGTGDFCRELEAVGLRAIGFDFAFEMLRAARTEAALVQADALSLPVASGSADAVTCGFALRNVVDLQNLFDEIGRVVRPGGRIALLEVSEPERALTRFGHRVYFTKIVPMIGGALSDRAAYRYLPRSVAYLPPPDELLVRLRNAGFPDAARIQLAMGAAQLLVGTRA